MVKKHYWNILEAIHVKMFGVFLFVCLLQVALKIPQMPTATSICSGLGQEARTLSASLIVGDRDLSTQAVCWHPGCALARSWVMSGEGGTRTRSFKCGTLVSQAAVKPLQPILTLRITF